MNIWEEDINDWDGDQYENFFKKKQSGLDDYSDFENDELDIEDIDFSNVNGRTKKDRLKKVSSKIRTAKVVPKKKRLAPNKSKSQKIIAKAGDEYIFKSSKGKQVSSQIKLPDNREILIKGVDEFILSKGNNDIKNIGYWQGEKLKELVLIINNDTPNDLTIEFFNPSTPLNYLYSTTDNLNNRIQVAGDNKVSYSDLLFNVLANPTILPNAKFTCSGPLLNQQFSQSMIFKNKNIEGIEKINPIQNALNFDILQPQKQIVYWDIYKTLGRLYCPDGMDIMEYTVLRGMTVVFGFYYKQIQLKKVLIPELRNKGIL
jgi:hypothetical protein